MKTKTSLLIIYLTTSGFLPATAFAEEQPAADKPAEDIPVPAIKDLSPAVEDLSLTEEGEPLVPVAFLSEPVISKIELGIGYVSDDAYKFGRYNGLQTQGPYVIGDIKAREFYEDGRFWSVRGTNLGLESRYLRMEGGTQGSYKLFLEYDELPNYKDNTVKTPFIGIGGNNLTLPPGFDIDTSLDASLNSFDLQTKRERIGVGASFIPKQQWQFDVDFNHENKQGVDATGGAIASGSSQIVGNTKTSLLPEPIDYETDIVNATLSYAGKSGQLGLGYQMSLFNNAYNSLNWQDPFNPAASGSMSLAPDNEFHQLSLSGGYYLPYRSHLTGLISMGRMTQNQNFQDYTINPNATQSALPRDSLDGEVWLTTAQLKLASRPADKLRLTAELKYQDRDNRTPVDTYNYIVLDSDSFTRSATNRPYSYTNNRFNLDANYRFNAITSLRGGYKYNQMKRRYTNAEREDTAEDTLFAKWKVKAHSTVDIALSAATSKRDGSDYIPLPNENPAMRKYYLADRNRDTVGASIDYMATDKLLLSLKADYNKDDYENSTIGLTEATQPVYTIDFSYQPRHDITTYGYYTHENIRSSQTSLDVSPSGTTNWESNFDDTFDTAGIGAKLTGLGKWDVGADVLHSKSTGAIVMIDTFNPGTEAQYPDTRTELNSLKLWTSYDYNKQLTYKLGYRYEKYSEDNWAVDGLQPYNPAVASNILLLGNQTLDYDVHVITASASYRF
jgi:MtrB/PioB family decaheme-associated outer membrane protein